MNRDFSVAAFSTCVALLATVMAGSALIGLLK